MPVRRGLVGALGAIDFADRGCKQVEPGGEVQMGVARPGIARRLSGLAFRGCPPRIIGPMSLHAPGLAPPSAPRANMRYNLAPGAPGRTVHPILRLHCYWGDCAYFTNAGAMPAEARGR